MEERLMKKNWHLPDGTNSLFSAYLRNYSKLSVQVSNDI